MDLIAERRGGAVARGMPAGGATAGIGRGRSRDEPAGLVRALGPGVRDDGVPDLAGKPRPRGAGVGRVGSPLRQRCGAQAMISCGGAGNGNARPSFAPPGVVVAGAAPDGIGRGLLAARAATASSEQTGQV